MKQLAILILVIALGTTLRAQTKSDIDSMLHVALQFYKYNNLKSARSEFLAIYQIDSLNKDAVYNLGVTNLNLGNEEEAINYFQKGVRLRDRESADVLKIKLKKKIEYADFMHYDDVDEQPKYFYKGQMLDLIEKKGLNEKLKTLLLKEIKKSRVVKRSNFKGKLYLNLEIDKSGNLICSVMKGSGNNVLDAEVKRIIEASAKFLPGRYDSREVGVWGWVLPISI
jgi:tetratricopeptide (TPR) repeat protein